ncbi:MAG: WbqC family protein [Bacteroidales bacterium]|jgi:hypothetical protein
MKLAIMQPYFFPYIGYFQLINAVDKFVIYDDVTFIKQGWINRNRILLNSKEHLITLNLKKASSFKFINDIEIHDNRNKILKTIEMAYKKAPFYNNTFSLIEEIIFFNEKNLSYFLKNSINKLAAFLNIKTEFILSSTLIKNNDIKGQNKVIDICKKMNTSTYINSIGGQELYSKEIFLKNNIYLKFIKSKPIIYNQFKNEFVSCLSIIDILMFNSKEEIAGMLNQYELI